MSASNPNQFTHCPLCESDAVIFYFADKRREYKQCQCCALVFVPQRFLPSLDEEKKEYALHQNNADDEGYRRFLNKAKSPLLPLLNANIHHGLDYGCGPAPVLATMFLEDKFEMRYYDPIFFPDRRNLAGQYHFITCTEAIEHFHRPGKELALLVSLLKQGGWLVIMTKRVIDKQRFANWHYKNDRTHVCFFSEATFHYIGQQYGLDVTIHSSDVVILQKRSPFNDIIH